MFVLFFDGFCWIIATLWFATSLRTIIDSTFIMNVVVVTAGVIISLFSILVLVILVVSIVVSFFSVIVVWISIFLKVSAWNIYFGLGIIVWLRLSVILNGGCSLFFFLVIDLVIILVFVSALSIIIIVAIFISCIPSISSIVIVIIAVLIPSSFSWVHVSAIPVVIVIILIILIISVLIILIMLLRLSLLFVWAFLIEIGSFLRFWGIIHWFCNRNDGGWMNWCCGDGGCTIWKVLEQGLQRKLTLFWFWLFNWKFK